MIIFVGNLSFNTDETALQELFAPLGAVESITLVRDRETGRSRGFAFVELADELGKTACETLDQREFEGRRLTVNEAKPQERRGGYAGGGGGRSGGFGRPKREARW